LPCQTYFRPTAIKLPSICHQFLPKSAPRSLTHGRLPQRAGDDPVTLRLAILTIRWKNASLLSLSTIIESGRSADERNALSGVYLCPIPFASSWVCRSSRLANPFNCQKARRDRMTEDK
jgi:hypothetical protein